MTWDLIATEIKRRIELIRTSLESCPVEKLAMLQGTLAAYRAALRIPEEAGEARRQQQTEELSAAQREAADKAWSGMR